MSPKSGLIEKAQVLNGLRENEMRKRRIGIHKLCKTKKENPENIEVQN